MSKETNSHRPGAVSYACAYNMYVCLSELLLGVTSHSGMCAVVARNLRCVFKCVGVFSITLPPKTLLLFPSTNHKLCNIQPQCCPVWGAATNLLDIYRK